MRVDVPLIMATAEQMSGQITDAKLGLRPAAEAHCQRWELEKWLTELDKRKTDRGKAGVPKPEFSFGSHAQVKWLLYESMGLPVLAKTKAGHPATDYDALTKLKAEVENPPIILDRLLAYAGLEMLYNTFVIGILERQVDGVLYPEFNVNGTKTGRISHSNPNMGNMPKEGVFRNFILPTLGKICGEDYTQLEVIIEANLTHDKNLVKIIMEGASKHDITAQALGVSRDVAKTLNFAMQYWCTAEKVAKLLKISRAEGLFVYNKYWETYSGPKALKEQTDRELETQGYVTNIFGRSRHFDLEGMGFWDLERAKRQAYNFKVQGPGGDIMNRAFYMRGDHLRKTGRGRALWTVHDETIEDIKEPYIAEEQELRGKTMCSIGDELGFAYPLATKPYGPFDRWCKA